MAEGGLMSKLKDFIATPRGKTVTVAVLIVVILLVFSIPLLFLLLGGPQVLVKKPEEVKKPPPAVKKAEVKEKEKKEEKVVESFEVYEYKDPFKPLITRPETVAPTGEATAAATTGPTPLALEDIYTENGVEYAQIKYGGTVYRVKEGEQVGDSPYKVLSIDSSSVTLLYGDDRLTLRVGEEIVK